MPGCRSPTRNIRIIPTAIRLMAMKKRRIHIPRGATACSIHQSIDNWNVNALKRWNKFTPNKIKEMIELLCNVKQKNTIAELIPGNTL